MEILAKARALIVPSRVYEGSPVVLAEAYARGVPVIGPRHGAFAEYIEDGETGRLFNPGDPVHLGECIRALHTPEAAADMGEGARRLSSGHLLRIGTGQNCWRSTVTCGRVVRVLTSRTRRLRPYQRARNGQ